MVMMFEGDAMTCKKYEEYVVEVMREGLHLHGKI
jgi:hypothetical protein